MNLLFVLGLNDKNKITEYLNCRNAWLLFWTDETNNMQILIFTQTINWKVEFTTVTHYCKLVFSVALSLPQ